MAAVTMFVDRPAFEKQVPGRRPTSRVATRAAIARGGRPSPHAFWRRRVTVAVIAVGLVVGAAQAGDALGGSSLAAPERHPAAERTWIDVVVRPGDSLWSIVERTFPGEDPRGRVDLLVRARGGAQLVAGEVIQVPT